jgi:7-cyano-7-deazaguanine synthase
MESSGATRDIVILSGGLDSTVCMAISAVIRGRPPIALTFDYGQAHRIEIARAEKIAAHYSAEHLIVSLDTGAWGGSALTDPSIAIPDASDHSSRAEDDEPSIPVTYVPARNTIFLAVALAVAEAKGSDVVYIGVNALDYSGYPDCRPEYLDAFRRVAELGQRRGLEGRPVEISAPLIDKSKADIVRLGAELDAPLALTWSCYRGGHAPCRSCDACTLRAKGFSEAGIADTSLGETDP